jgi:hypothetical protein
MAHLIERALSARSKCRGCGEKIASGKLRFGEQLPNPFADGPGSENALMTHWFHMPCAAFRRPEAFLEGIAGSAEVIENRAELEQEAQLGVTHRRLPRISTAERAPTGRANCRACKTPIEKDTWRIALVFYDDGRFVPSGFMHASCVKDYIETTAIGPRMKHFSPKLSQAEFEEIQRQVSGWTGERVNG